MNWLLHVAGRNPGTPKSRRLWLERLESRCLLSTFLVNSASDNLNQDGVLTLREAIAIVNAGSLSRAGHTLTAAEAAGAAIHSRPSPTTTNRRRRR
jgi:hypothetical protein